MVLLGVFCGVSFGGGGCCVIPLEHLEVLGLGM